MALQYVSEILDRGTFTRDYGSKQDTVNLDDTKGMMRPNLQQSLY